MMSYTDFCSICHESYDDDNLATCVRCGRSYCYRCGGQLRGCCQHCSPDLVVPEAMVPEAEITEAKSLAGEASTAPPDRIESRGTAAE